MTTNNLTEQWKKGELELGKYYIKTIYGGVVEDTHIRTKVGRVWNNYQDDEITEVLAPAPSWEQWQQMKAFCEEFNALEVSEENQRLKELIKECRVLIEWYKADCGYEDLPTESVLTKIDEVLK